MLYFFGCSVIAVTVVGGRLVVVGDGGQW